MLIQEEGRIFDELLSRFDALSDEQMQVVGVTREWSTKDLLGHLAYWERSAMEQARELESGTWSPRKLTPAQVNRINREVVTANKATPRQKLREEWILARAEIVAALRRAPEEIEENSPLARIVRSQCVRHRGHHLAQLRAWVEHLQNGS